MRIYHCNGIYQFVTHLLLCAFLFCMFVCLFFIDMWSEVIYTHHWHGFHRNFGFSIISLSFQDGIIAQHTSFNYLQKTRIGCTSLK